MAMDSEEDSSSRLKHRKLALVIAVLLPTYIGWFIGLDPSTLTGIVSVIVGAFCASDSINTYTYRKYNQKDRSHADWGSGG